MNNGADHYSRFLSGDKKAFEEIVQNYKDGLIFYLFSIVSDIHEAEELATDTFIILYTQRPKFKGEGAFKTWLYSIGRHIALEDKYREILEKLGEQGGILGKIFKGATNKISNAAILSRIVAMIDKEKWVSMSSDVKGEIYEGLLQKNAEDIKSGAGQYFTPRPLIKAMVRCIRPEPMKSVADKAVTGLIQGIPQIGAISGLFANGRPMRSYFFALSPVC